MIVCRTLGPVDVSVDGTVAPAELLWRKNLALLVYLARSPKRARTREHLIGLLWADKPEAAARHSLNEAIRVVRHHAGEAGVETDAGQVRLASDAVRLDTDRFEELAAGRNWREASALVVGEFLEGFAVPGASAFEDWLTAERALWRRRGVDALLRRIDELLLAGGVSQATDLAHRARALDATSDPAARAAIRCLALAGDRAAALTAYEDFARRLEADVGTAPDGETRALAERVRKERVYRVSGPAAAPAQGAESRRTPLVGREAELERLVQAWAACRTGRRATVAVVQGDPGTGKTRLAEEVVARARLDGAATATARAVEADVGDAWSGVVALARTGGLLDTPGLASAPAEALAAFAARAPEWADRFAGPVRGVVPAPMSRALSDALRAVTDEQPVVLAIDDAHRFDRESLLALNAAARDLARAPLYLLLTMSPQPARAELDELRARIGRDLAGATVTLAPLGSEALRALARWAFPAYGDVEVDRLTRRVGTDSAGLPLLAVELLHAVALGMDLGQVSGAWPEASRTLDQTLPGELPDAVRAAVRVGFRRLSAEAQRVLGAAAVLAERVPMDALARTTELAESALAAALDELEWQRWLTAEPRGYAFLARIVREVVAEDLVTAGQKQRMLASAKGGAQGSG